MKSTEEKLTEQKTTEERVKNQEHEELLKVRTVETPSKIQELLDEPFDPLDLEWRILNARVNNGGAISATCVPYVQARAIHERFDSIFGKFGWKADFKQIDKGFTCNIYVWWNGQWISKEDGAQGTQIEYIKGGMSAALKRAAVVWGVGRYFYRLGVMKAIIGSDPKVFLYKGRAKGEANNFTSFLWKPPALPEYALPDEYTKIRDAEVREIYQYYPKLTDEQKELIDRKLESGEATRKWAWKIIDQIKQYLDQKASEQNEEEQSKHENKGVDMPQEERPRIQGGIENSIDDIDSLFPTDSDLI